VVGFNPCVTGDTEILTRDGYKQIESLVGKSVEVWNGFEWSEVTPKITGYDQQLLSVSFSDGRELNCTPYHKFHVSTNYQGGSKIIEAKDLEPGMKLIKHEFPIIEHGEDYKYGYDQGFISADGQDGYNYAWVHSPKYPCMKRMNGSALSEYGDRRVFRFNHIPLPKSFVPFSWNLKSRLDWLAGLFDGDGTELKEGGLQLVSVNRQFLRELQSLLSTVGVQCKIVPGHQAGLRLLPDGNGGKKEYHCQESSRICIGATQIQHLKKLGLKCERLSFDKTPQRDCSQFVTVVDVTENGSADKVYCFNEPKRHLGIFNGVITGQCAEQSLADKETCCLAEVYLPNIKSLDEMKEVTSYLYRINKHSLALPCHHPETEAIVHKNMRMGIGITGYLQSTEEQKSWLSPTYEYLRKFDKEYSKRHGFPESIKLTTVKPSGTLSLLAGVTPGCHPGFSEFYIRRVRMAANSPLVNVCRQHGYETEWQRKFDGSIDNNTVVVSFPCSFPKGTVLVRDITAVKQLEYVKRLQEEWSDNAVSCTVYYKKEELGEIKEWLSKNYNHSLKTVSFLLHKEHGFDQAPLEEITEERYNEMKAKTKPIESVSFKEDDIMGSDECQSGVCPIK
jgi:ribonucleotide reductase alpha subunit